jgi:glycerol kinase
MVQSLAAMAHIPVDRPANLESTALGAAFAAGWQAGIYPGPESFAARRRPDRLFIPAMDEAAREGLYRGWREAVRRAL